MNPSLRFLVVLLISLLGSPLVAAFTEGVEYTRYPTTLLQQAPIQQWLDDNPGKVQVIEFFSFACPRCHAFEPSVQKWVAQKSEKVIFWKVPVIFHPNWRPLAKAYFMIDTLKGHAKWDPLVFAEIHEKHTLFSSDTQLRDFFIENGLAAKAFDDTYSSSGVSRSLKWGEDLSRAFQITMVPSLVVYTSAGTFLITTKMGGDNASIIQILDYLIAQHSTQKAP